MMKILLLNPHLYEAPILKTLQNLGVAVIVCADFKECELVHKFHASSITLFVGHDEDGVKMNELLKKNPRFAKTPVILTTSKWSEQECIDHQASPFTANAYLRMPVDDKDFIHVIDEILGTELSHGKGLQVSDDVSLAPVGEVIPLKAVSPHSMVQLEDAASVYGVPTPGVDSVGDLSLSGLEVPGLNFALEAPSLGVVNETLEMKPIESDGPSSLAIPIEAMSSEATEFVDLPEFVQPTSPDEQATRVAISPLAKVDSPSIETESSSQEIDSEALAAMPYLSRGTPANYSNPLDYREPMDDAVVPGGAATAPDVETLKKYLYLREQDVTALSAQLRQAREQIGSLEGQLKHEKATTAEFAYLAQEQDRRIVTFDKEKAVAVEFAQKELEEVKFEMRRRSEKIRVMELLVKEATEATERLKERVRGDIRKIRAREKELENRLEIMKKDSEALLGSREQKIIELKRKLDLIEFNTDLLQDQLEKERRTNALLRDKLAKAAQIVRVAGGLLSPEEEALLTNRDMSDTTRTSAA